MVKFDIGGDEMINLLQTENNEIIRATITCSDDLDVLDYLFPNSILELDTMGNEIIAIIKEDHAV